MDNISFADWWDDGVGKPVDVGYDCAYAAWKYKEQQLDRQRQQLEDYALSNIQDRQELAAAQAREKVMYSLLNELLYQIDINDFMDSYGDSAKMLKVVHDLMNYNTQPSDDIVLKAATQHGITEFLERTGQYVTNDASRKAALKEERERCAKICDQWNEAHPNKQITSAVSATIRALGD